MLLDIRSVLLRGIPLYVLEDCRFNFGSLTFYVNFLGVKIIFCKLWVLKIATL